MWIIFVYWKFNFSDLYRNFDSSLSRNRFVRESQLKTNIVLMISLAFIRVIMRYELFLEMTQDSKISTNGTRTY